MLDSAPRNAAAVARQALRKTLLAQREKFVAGPAFEAAARALAQHLRTLLRELEPELLGLYWAQRGEFNAVAALEDDSLFTERTIALPFARRAPVRMDYRAWDGREPGTVDDCGIPASTGAPASPDVVLVPCVGFTADGFRLGYGGGYFDRWLAAHPDVTTVGVAWACGRMDASDFTPEPHDLTLALTITEDGVV